MSGIEDVLDQDPRENYRPANETGEPWDQEAEDAFYAEHPLVTARPADPERLQRPRDLLGEAELHRALANETTGKPPTWLCGCFSVDRPPGTCSVCPHPAHGPNLCPVPTNPITGERLRPAPSTPAGDGLDEERLEEALDICGIGPVSARQVATIYKRLAASQPRNEDGLDG